MPLCSFRWKGNSDGAPRTVVVIGPDRASHEGDKLFHQGQPYAGSPGGSGEVTVHPIEIIENFF